MANDNVVLRFDEVTFEFELNKPLLDEASFSMRNGSKFALMGQNGSGKTTLFKMIMGELKTKAGNVFSDKDAKIAIAKQIMDPKFKPLTVREYFATAFDEKIYNLDKRIADVFEVVNADLPLDKTVNKLSGGQQAKLLLAYALIQEPDILLLDEPTNNLDQDAIDHLTTFLIMYDKTCLVISHDAEFLNMFTDGVLYLDVFTKKIEQYTGNYYDVVEEIKNRIERENMQNARMEKNIQSLKEKSEFFAHKGGRLRSLAKKMREQAEDYEEEKVDVRREDRAIKEFTIPAQEFDPFFGGTIATITRLEAYRNGEVREKPVEIALRKGIHFFIAGPNGIGKTTFLEKLATRQAEEISVSPEVRIGYYRQDFSTLDFEQTGYEALEEVMAKEDEQVLRATASRFLLDGKILGNQIKFMSEGQKGLLMFARLVLMKPGLLVLDEPTNHINFRHLPVIAKALNEFEGSMILVSHIPDFVKQIRLDQQINLGDI